MTKLRRTVFALSALMKENAKLVSIQKQEQDILAELRSEEGKIKRELAKRRESIKALDKLISDITHEYNITTIVNTHDMNSVMEIGDKVVFIYEGIKCWEGTKNEILHSDNQYLNDFVFATNLAKTVKRIQNG